MNKNIKIAIILIGLLILVGIIYMYKNKAKNVDISDQNNSSSTDGSNTEKDESTQINSSTGTTSNEEFNTYIAKARTEFINKNYAESLSYYNKALSIEKTDVVYAGMYTVYTAENNWIDALAVLDKAVELKPSFTDYWIWKIGLLDEKMNTSFTDLKKIYDQAVPKVNSKTKINLVTYFANVSEDNGEIATAINLWKEAQSIFPDNSATYQKEIDRLSL